MNFKVESKALKELTGVRNKFELVWIFGICEVLGESAGNPFKMCVP